MPSLFSSVASRSLGIPTCFNGGVTHWKHWFWVKLALITFIATSTTGVPCNTAQQYALADIVYIYCSVVRSVLEYACAVWHPGLSNKLSTEIDRVQKRCLKIIYPNLSYSEALEKSGLVRLDSRREEITRCTFRQVKCPTHPLHYLLPPQKVSTSQMTLRPTYPFSAPKCKKQDMVEI